MANTQPNDTQNVKIQGILGRYLELRSHGLDRGESAGHLDEDTLNAFTEGNISEREALPIVDHLTDCSFCRHKTVELVQMDLQFADMDEPVRMQETSEPVSVSSVLSGILSRIFGSSEGAVFAHQEQEKEEKDEEKEKKEED